MYNRYVKIGQIWEWKYKNRGFPFSSSIYLIVGDSGTYFELVEISSTNTRIQKDAMTADNWKLFIDVEPNR